MSIDSNPRMVETLPKPHDRLIEVGNADKAVLVSHGDGVVEYTLTPANARRLASILRWQADMAEQGPPATLTVNFSEVSEEVSAAYAEEIGRAREAMS